LEAPSHAPHLSGFPHGHGITAVPPPIAPPLASDPSAYATFLASRPQSLESDAISLIARCAAKFPALRTHIVHLSASDALPTIRASRAAGLPLTVETCFHYLVLSAEQIAKGETLYKCCPPIREAANREALWAALVAGDIDFVVSDHSPCTVELKKLEEGDFMSAWGGIGGLGLGLSLLWTEAARRGIAMGKVLEWVSERPAKQVRIEDQKGALKVGADADFVVFDAELEFSVISNPVFDRLPARMLNSAIPRPTTCHRPLAGHKVGASLQKPCEPVW